MNTVKDASTLLTISTMEESSSSWSIRSTDEWPGDHDGAVLVCPPLFMKIHRREQHSVNVSDSPSTLRERSLAPTRANRKEAHIFNADDDMEPRSRRKTAAPIKLKQEDYPEEEMITLSKMQPAVRMRGPTTAIGSKLESQLQESHTKEIELLMKLEEARAREQELRDMLSSTSPKILEIVLRETKARLYKASFYSECLDEDKIEFSMQLQDLADHAFYLRHERDHHAHQAIGRLERQFAMNQISTMIRFSPDVRELSFKIVDLSREATNLHYRLSRNKVNLQGIVDCLQMDKSSINQDSCCGEFAIEAHALEQFKIDFLTKQVENLSMERDDRKESLHDLLRRQESLQKDKEQLTKQLSTLEEEFKTRTVVEQEAHNCFHVLGSFLS
jgi:hypothetical protein